MKKHTYFLTLMLALTVPVYAVSEARVWQTEFECNDRAFVIDKSYTSGPSSVIGQMVMKGEIVEWLVSDIKIIDNSRLNDKGEFILATDYDERGVLRLTATMYPARIGDPSWCFAFNPALGSLKVVVGGFCNYEGHEAQYFELDACGRP
jgi:hypothetical protein